MLTLGSGVDIVTRRGSWTDSRFVQLAEPELVALPIASDQAAVWGGALEAQVAVFDIPKDAEKVALHVGQRCVAFVDDAVGPALGARRASRRRRGDPHRQSR